MQQVRESLPPLPRRPLSAALNWYWSVRVKLDDPAYSSWFMKFDGFSDSPYPGGLGLAQNGSFHV